MVSVSRQARNESRTLQSRLAPPHGRNLNWSIRPSDDFSAESGEENNWRARASPLLMGKHVTCRVVDLNEPDV